MSSTDILSAFINNTGDGHTIQQKNGYDYLVFELQGEIGVMIKATRDCEPIDETFASIRIRTELQRFGGVLQKFVILSTTDREYLSKFSHVCDDFVEPGRNGEQRQVVSSKPLEWWKEWKDLIGNVSRVQDTYSILGEMIVVDYLASVGENPVWEGLSGSVRDINCQNIDAEVKSTLNRYAYMIEASGEFQFEPDAKRTHLFFCRFEKSDSGINIDEMAKILERDSVMTRDSIEEILTNANLPEGRSARKSRYRLIQMKEYVVNQDFPCITKNSFKGDTIPLGVSHIRYEIDLENLESQDISYRPRSDQGLHECSELLPR